MVVGDSPFHIVRSKVGLRNTAVNATLFCDSISPRHSVIPLNQQQFSWTIGTRHDTPGGVHLVLLFSLRISPSSAER